MILFRNRLIFGVVRKFISGVLLSVYKVLSLFNLQYTLLIACIGAVLYLTGVLSGSQVILVIFLILLGLSVVYAIFTTLSRILGLDKKKKKKKAEEPTTESLPQQATMENFPPVQVVPEAQPISPQPYTFGFSNQQGFEQPKYFKVNGHPDYIMAEYSDRYELYKVTNGQMIKIRTDYKY